MRKLNEMVESLQLAAMNKMHANLQSNKQAHGELIKKLLVQGLIKLFEPSVILRVRKSDLKLV